MDVCDYVDKFCKLAAMEWGGPEKSTEVKALLYDMGVLQKPMEWSKECGCYIPEGMDPEEFEKLRDKLRELRPDMFSDGAW
jgi:hypothetical protein